MTGERVASLPIGLLIGTKVLAVGIVVGCVVGTIIAMASPMDTDDTWLWPDLTDPFTSVIGLWLFLPHIWAVIVVLRVPPVALGLLGILGGVVLFASIDTLLIVGYMTALDSGGLLLLGSPAILLLVAGGMQVFELLIRNQASAPC